MNESRGPEEEGGLTHNVLKQHEYGTIKNITTDEVRKALKDIGKGKVVGPDNIPIEVWRCLGEEDIRWLTNLFNVIWRSHRMPEEWRRIGVHLFLCIKKGDAQACGNYRGIKLLSYTMKLWERVIENGIGQEAVIKEHQFVLCQGDQLLRLYMCLED